MSDTSINYLEEKFRSRLAKELDYMERKRPTSSQYTVEAELSNQVLHGLLNIKRKDAEIAELQARTQLWNTLNKRLEDGSWKNVIEALVKEIKKKEGHVNV